MITFEARGWTFEQLARRICDLVYGGHYDIYLSSKYSNQPEDEITRYQVGNMNDLWLHKEPDCYKLHFRYHSDERTAWVMAAIKDVIQRSQGERLELT